ncbi:hypothetical protein [Almyronema epifaneia]|uniref:Uncharacterized protein n=1 Tax=Almyronema epifaneia S1 TaxID=2991925 RepID=A0ABW6ICI4_9CYAN
MLLTTEIRWFQLGDPPRSLTDWFYSEALGSVRPTSATREDCYLVLPHDTFLGVKFRQGNLEVKWRQAELGQIQLGETWTGQLERWLKWSYAEAADCQNSPLQAYLQSGGWVSVKKTRSQRIYQIQAEQVIPVEALPPGDRGCSLELTCLEANHQRWWTVGFEAEGNPQQSLQALRLTLVWLSVTANLPPLEQLASYAYPYWLAQLGADA